MADDGGMTGRGAARPEMEGGGRHGRAERLEMLREHHHKTLWIYWSLLLLGVWLMVSPATFDYGLNPAVPSGGRELWLSLEARVRALAWSDFLSGALLTFFAWRSLTPDRPRSLWACCLLGIWISGAPLFFWAPQPAVYLNDTLVGALVIALSILAPGMPNMIAYMRMGNEQPPGWTYNPSSWTQRSVLILAGFLGWLVSRYLAAYQLGYIAEAWDPFFGGSTMRVLDSAMSKSLPISDAALGTYAYTFEFLMGWMGSPARWRTMPWMVAFFGILVIPLGLVHIFLVISQPLAVGAWCSGCLLAAAIMLPMIPLEVDEVVAMFQNLKAARRRGESVWRAFWLGGPAEGCAPDRRSPDFFEFPSKPGGVFQASLWGMSFPPALLGATAVGALTVFLPAIFGAVKPVSHAAHLAGLLFVVFSVIAMGEVVRAARWLNLPVAAGLAAAPWLMGAETAFSAAATACALAVALLSIPRGRVLERYGAWDAWVR